MPPPLDWMSSLPVTVRRRVLRLLLSHSVTQPSVVSRAFTAASSGGGHAEHLPASWNAAAPTYAALWTTALEPFARSALDATSSSSRSSSPAQRHVLDVGCGSGTLALLAASECSDISHVTAVDYSPSMLETMQRTQLRLNINEQRLQCHVMDAQVRSERIDTERPRDERRLSAAADSTCPMFRAAYDVAAVDWHSTCRSQHCPSTPRTACSRQSPLSA